MGSNPDNVSRVILNKPFFFCDMLVIGNAYITDGGGVNGSIVHIYSVHSNAVSSVSQ